MRRFATLALVLALNYSTAGGATQPVRQASFNVLHAQQIDPYYAPHQGIDARSQPFRWGWFGAEWYPPAPKSQRTYNHGWRKWQYYR